MPKKSQVLVQTQALLINIVNRCLCQKVQVKDSRGNQYWFSNDIERLCYFNSINNEFKNGKSPVVLIKSILDDNYVNNFLFESYFDFNQDNADKLINQFKKLRFSTYKCHSKYGKQHHFRINEKSIIETNIKSLKFKPNNQQNSCDKISNDNYSTLNLTMETLVTESYRKHVECELNKDFNAINSFPISLFMNFDKQRGNDLIEFMENKEQIVSRDCYLAMPINIKFSDLNQNLNSENDTINQKFVNQLLSKLNIEPLFDKNEINENDFDLNYIIYLNSVDYIKDNPNVVSKADITIHLIINDNDIELNEMKMGKENQNNLIKLKATLNFKKKSKNMLSMIDITDLNLI